jgi:uncharacterized membrane-anchored protein
MSISPRVGSFLGFFTSIYLPIVISLDFSSKSDSGIFQVVYFYLLTLSVGLLVVSLVYIFHFRNGSVLSEAERNATTSNHSWPKHFLIANLVLLGLLALDFSAAGTLQRGGGAPGIIVIVLAPIIVGVLYTVASFVVWACRADERTKEWSARVVLPFFALMTLLLTALH